jgi:hypothetical protein
MKKILLTILLCLWATVAFAASISTLTDNFDDNSIDAAKWTNHLTDWVEQNNELEETTSTAGSDKYISSVNAYDLTGSQATIKVVDAGNVTLASRYFYPLIIVDADLNTNKLYWLIRDSSIRAIGGDAYYEQTYVAATYRYLKIREASGIIYWDYSSDGISWTNATSIANPFSITSKVVLFEDYVDVESSTTTAKIDDFNILPSATAPTFSHAFNNGFNEGMDGFN